LSRDLQLNCVISFFFRLHLVLHICAARFDVTGTVALFGFAFLDGNPTKQAVCVGFSPLFLSCDTEYSVLCTRVFLLCKYVMVFVFPKSHKTGEGFLAFFEKNRGVVV
jgi:hypothetical protein